ncbi:N2227-domain-containing protein [Trametes versicolor FP-101664 SS1]|uniref:N2227-domain-containing protein n=1 Tax=Trametes versicolor (strain FP-101664) TaxID=717944 RepID=UPI0004621671|nr:N2227-domain-containing protein [Trametes versicolor FP-101664 SS1]EIW53331.1 N2227-domain-containing protein [Trametes versicolor FP-101664 SS1]
MPLTQADIDEERTHFANVIATFQQYAPYALNANNRRRKDIHIIPIEDRELLEQIGYKQRISATDDAILANAEFLNLLTANPEIFGQELAEDPVEGSADQPESSRRHDPRRGQHSHEHSGSSHSHSVSHPHRGHSHGGGHSHSHDSPQDGSSRTDKGRGGKRRYKPTEHDMEKLRSTLKQLVRDWSEEGKAERDVCYEPIKEALLQHFSDIPQEERGNFRVLVPGAGLGRLAWDVANLGFACQGNEFSHYMLLASFHMLNRTDAVNKHTIYPYIHSFSNLLNSEGLLRPIRIPDVLPSGLAPGSDFSLVAGDFEEIYGAEEGDDAESQVGQWDAVLTCFFIDTAKNIINYLRIIHRILAPGGVWINLGPLLWHWENNTTNDPSIELTLDEVKALARSIGFEISNERTIDTTYTNNAQSMLGYVYHASFWTATKII